LVAVLRRARCRIRQRSTLYPRARLGHNFYNIDAVLVLVGVDFIEFLPTGRSALRISNLAALAPCAMRPVVQFCRERTSPDMSAVIEISASPDMSAVIETLDIETLDQSPS
jgi:hypothetical protein